jgi:hypothetical protein
LSFKLQYPKIVRLLDSISKHLFKEVGDAKIDAQAKIAAEA